MRIEEGTLRRQRPGDPKAFLQVVVLEAHRKEVMGHYHDSLMGGHLGLYKTYGRLSRACYWKQMYMDLECYLRTCETCEGGTA